MYFLGFLFLTVIEKSFREDRNVYTCKCIIFITSSSTNALSLKFVQMDF